MRLQIVGGQAQPSVHPPTKHTRPQPSERLEDVRRRVSFALAEMSADYALDFETRDTIARSLVAALRELEAAQLSVHVLQRKAVAHV